jgi:hypothetical protein
LTQEVEELPMERVQKYPPIVIYKAVRYRST